MQAPKIDPRTREDIVQQTEELAQKYTKEKGVAWQPAKKPDQIDAGGALIRIFARFAEHVIDRLNQVPEKNFLTFLNLIGTRIKPPQPARVPLTFSLAANSPVNAKVPVGTQVAAPPRDAQAKEVIFETEGDLVVTRSQLTAVYVHDTGENKYSERTSRALRDKDDAFPIFTGNNFIECYLYLACDPLLTRPGQKNVTFSINEKNSTDKLKNLTLTWAYWDGEEWKKKEVTQKGESNSAAKPATANPSATANTEGGELDPSPSSSSENNEWPVTIEDLPPLGIRAVNGVKAGWLRVTVGNWHKNQDALAAIKKDNITVSVDGTGVLPEAGFSNALPLDLSKDFYPFGETPRFNDTFYLAYDGQLAQPKTKMTINLELRNPASTKNKESNPANAKNGQSEPAKDEKSESASAKNGQSEPAKDKKSESASAKSGQSEPAKDEKSKSASAKNGQSEPASEKTDGPKSVNTSGKAQLAWEVWDGTTWQAQKTTEVVTTKNFEDKTQAFTKNGKVEFTLPAKIEPTMVNGKLAYWLRVRLISGNYGAPASYEEYTEVYKFRGYKLKEATFAPPVVKAIRFRYEQARLSACQLYHEFTYHDCKAKVANSQGSQQDKSTDEQPPKSTSKQKNDAEAKFCEQSALYLGFDKAFENRRITLYARVESQKTTEVVISCPSGTTNPKTTEVVTSGSTIRWQYASPDGKWTSLNVEEDETRNLTRSGLIRFIGPKDFEKRKLFGKDLYWLRACLLSSQKIGVNATQTSEVSETSEVFPRQAEPQLRRLVLNTTWASQRQTIRNEVLGSSNGKKNQSFCTAQAPVLEGQQIEVRDSQLNQIGQREESWVRWLPQPDFYSSGPDDRHYVFDHLTGNVRFGNGRQGKIPPRGRKNIRAALYRTGGGQAGNLPAGAIVELKSSVPYIDSVTNQVPASGGVEQEALAKVKERGPKRLRHRDRAVTPEDFEDLARQASPKVARAKVIYPLLKKENKASYNMTNTETTQPMVNGKSIDKGQINLILVPDSDEQQPTPSLNLIRRVREYLRSRCAATLDVDKDLQITGPTWVKVTVTVSATIRPNSSDNTDLEATVKEALTRFLHPLTGGTDGKGWPFGRKPYKSDLYALIQRVPGVDHVDTLKVEPKNETLQTEHFLISSGEHDIKLLPSKQ